MRGAGAPRTRGYGSRSKCDSGRLSVEWPEGVVGPAFFVVADRMKTKLASMFTREQPDEINGEINEIIEEEAPAH